MALPPASVALTASIDAAYFWTGLVFGALNFVVGLVYPAWSSMGALRSADPTDDTQWLTYWLSYAMLLIVEYALSWLLQWIPFYTVLRFVLLLWMAVPYLRGAEYLYENVYQPQFQKFKVWLGQAPALQFVKPPEPKKDEEGSQDAQPVKDQDDPFVASLRRRVTTVQ